MWCYGKKIALFKLSSAKSLLPPCMSLWSDMHPHLNIVTVGRPIIALATTTNKWLKDDIIGTWDEIIGGEEIIRQQKKMSFVQPSQGEFLVYFYVWYTYASCGHGDVVWYQWTRLRIMNFFGSKMGEGEREGKRRGKCGMKVKVHNSSIFKTSWWPHYSWLSVQEPWLARMPHSLPCVASAECPRIVCHHLQGHDRETSP